MEELRSWRPVWLAACLIWVLAVALYVSGENDRQVERLGRWAAAIESVINADPAVRLSAKELRAKLGDEEFIAAAPAAYPHVDLRETMRGYQQEVARHPIHEDLLGAFLLWALAPPLVLYGLGVVAEAIAALLRRRRSTTP